MTGGERRGALSGQRWACGDMTEKRTAGRGREGKGWEKMLFGRKGAVFGP